MNPLSSSSPNTEKISPNPLTSSSPNELESNSQDTSSSNATAQPSYVRLAMRNMVRKGHVSLKHFFLSTLGLLALLVGLAYLTR